MIWSLEINEQGLVTRWSSEIKLKPWIQVETEYNPLDLFVWEGVVKLLPEKPNGASAFDPVTETWQVDIDKVTLTARKNMQCSRMQGILALGVLRWNEVLAYRETASWSEQVVIDSASDWYRLSQNIEFFAYLLNLSETEIDDLFILAQSITA